MLGFAACAFQRGGLSKAIRELPERLPQAEVGVGGKTVGYMCIYIYMYVNILYIIYIYVYIYTDIVIFGYLIIRDV